MRSTSFLRGGLAVLLLCPFFWLRAAPSGTQQRAPRADIHSHNDYRQDRPLSAALEKGIASVEADIWLIEDELYVSHDRPSVLDPERTLAKLYLEPLAAGIRANEGAVFPGYRGPFLLMIDFKTEAAQTFRRLEEVLAPFRELLGPPIRGDAREQGPVTLVLSGLKGRRPFFEVLSQGSPGMVLDGTPDELGLDIPASRCPLISAQYSRYFAHGGDNEETSSERERFRALVAQTHAEGKRLRVWGIPQNERVWARLLDAGMDILNADDLERALSFLERRNKRE